MGCTQGSGEKVTKGLFVGLATLDVIQLVEKLPAENEKIRALDFAFAAGGPAANAAVAFAHGFSKLRQALENTDHAVLVSRISNDGIGDLIREDLEKNHVCVKASALPGNTSSTMATVLVTKSTGDRAVVSATDQRKIAPAYSTLDIEVEDFDIVETDGYETDLTLQVLKRARSAGVTTVLDGGSVKSYTEELLPFIDVAIVSEPFAADRSSTDFFNYLAKFGIKYSAITRGSKEIIYSADGAGGTIKTCKTTVVDTLAAGDFFHGGFVKALGKQELTADTFSNALAKATKIAALSIQSFGTRKWLEDN